MIKQIVEILNGKALRPDPADVRYPLSERMAGQSFMVAIFGKSCLEMAAVSCDMSGQFTVADYKYEAISQTDRREAHFIQTYASEQKLSHCLIGVSSCVVSIAMTAGTHPADEATKFAMLTASAAEAMQVIGKDSSYSVKPGKRVYPLQNAGFERQLVFEFDIDTLKTAQAAIGGLTCLGIRCPALSWLRMVARDNPKLLASGDVALLGEQFSFILQTSPDGEWRAASVNSSPTVTPDGLFTRMTGPAPVKAEIIRDTDRAVVVSLLLAPERKEKATDAAAAILGSRIIEGTKLSAVEALCNE